ncbi:hypothetical protein [Bacillus sp. FJAT-27445]|uniref:hypothetical protein n=1 Tax=Bacillus sp. FJAT-27445 TaxID=1679166 RepID=UPI000743967D|nr:hypothetical protein [Bacillus sp. FJAT-27445]
MSFNQNHNQGQMQMRNRVRRIEIDADQVIIRTNNVRIEGLKHGRGYDSMNNVAGAEDYNWDDSYSGMDDNVGGAQNRGRHCKDRFWI